MAKKKSKTPSPKPLNKAGIMSISTVIIIALLAFIAWRFLGNSSNASYQNISVQELAQVDNPFILDVRTQGEFSQGHIKGAMLIPVTEVAQRVSEVPDGIPVYVICRSGNRSTTASSILSQAGKEAINVKGGMLAWQAAGYKVE